MSLAYTAPGYRLVQGVPAGQGDCHLVGDRRVHPQLTVIQESTGGCREKADPGAIQGIDTDWEADSLRGQKGRGAAGDSASRGLGSWEDRGPSAKMRAWSGQGWGMDACLSLVGATDFEVWQNLCIKAQTATTSGGGTCSKDHQESELEDGNQERPL